MNNLAGIFYHFPYLFCCRWLGRCVLPMRPIHLIQLTIRDVGNNSSIWIASVRLDGLNTLAYAHWRADNIPWLNGRTLITHTHIYRRMLFTHLLARRSGPLDQSLWANITETRAHAVFIMLHMNIGALIPAIHTRNIHPPQSSTHLDEMKWCNHMVVLE